VTIGKYHGKLTSVVDCRSDTRFLPEGTVYRAKGLCKQYNYIYNYYDGNIYLQYEATRSCRDIISKIIAAVFLEILVVSLIV
jgi:hypothetical protein